MRTATERRRTNAVRKDWHGIGTVFTMGVLHDIEEELERQAQSTNCGLQWWDIAITGRRGRRIDFTLDFGWDYEVGRDGDRESEAVKYLGHLENRFSDRPDYPSGAEPSRAVSLHLVGPRKQR